MKTKKDIFGFNKGKLKQWFLYWTVLGVSFIVLVFLITSTQIGISVKKNCPIAQGRYTGDCTEALVKTFDDQNNTYRERNTAAWSLGQLGDPRALPVLEKHYTGQIPSKEPYDQVLSQYEIKKALKLLRGGLNLTHLVWNPQKI
jgi:hypothetical protein